MKQRNICRIEIAGVHKLDLVFYCAYILSRMEFRVLVCDFTRHKETQFCIRKPRRQMELVRYKEIDFALSDFAASDDSYDYIFYVQDEKGETFVRADRYIWVCDGHRRHIVAFEQLKQRRFEQQVSPDCVLMVFRNLFAAYGLEGVSKASEGREHCVRELRCAHDCMDEAAYERLQYMPFTHIPNISPELEGCIRNILQFSTGIEEKQLKRGIRLAKRGRAY